MPLVARDHVGDRPDADRFTARRTAALPGVGIEGPQQRQRRGARGAQLTEQIGERARIELCDGHVRVFVESGERRLIAARDP